MRLCPSVFSQYSSLSVMVNSSTTKPTLVCCAGGGEHGEPDLGECGVAVCSENHSVHAVFAGEAVIRVVGFQQCSEVKRSGVSSLLQLRVRE